MWKRTPIVLLATFAGAGVAMYGTMIALSIYIWLRVPSPRSTTGAYTFIYGVEALPIGAVLGLLAGILWLAPKIPLGRRAKLSAS